MEINHREIDKVLVVKPLEDRLDASSASDFKERIVGLIEQGRQYLVLNLEQVDFIDSTGMTAIVSILKALGLAGGELALCGVGSTPAHLFKLTKMDRVLNILASEEEAVRVLRP